MYKKTTTTIIEETDADIFGGSFKASPSKGVFTDATPENSATGVAIRMSLMQHYNKFVSELREYLVSKQTTPDAVPVIVSALSKFKDETAQIMTPYTGFTLTPKIVQAQEEVINGMLGVIDSVSAGQNANAVTEAARAKILAFDKVLTSGFAPNILPEGSVATYWNSLLSAVTQQANSRTAKDWVADQAAVVTGFDTMVFGPPTGVVGFADALGRAVVLNNPNRWIVG